MTQNQPSLFADAIRIIDAEGDVQHQARSTDPTTSHEAAGHVASSLPKLQARMLAAFSHREPRTDNEAAAWCVYQYGENMHESYRKRGGEIRDRLISCGERKCAVSGRVAMTWRAK